VRGRCSFTESFEISRLALPYHAGMRSYGLVTFQWSCHTVASLGDQPTHAEWLNKTDVWPNRAFAESLREAIGDSGPVLTWSHFEGTTLKQIIADLDKFGHVVPELVEWMTDVMTTAGRATFYDMEGTSKKTWNTSNRRQNTDHERCVETLPGPGRALCCLVPEWSCS
jgi:Domain of unknown function(DUF2779)